MIQVTLLSGLMFYPILHESFNKYLQEQPALSGALWYSLTRFSLSFLDKVSLGSSVWTGIHKNRAALGPECWVCHHSWLA